MNEREARRGLHRGEEGETRDGVPGGGGTHTCRVWRGGTMVLLSAPRVMRNLFGTNIAAPVPNKGA